MKPVQIQMLQFFLWKFFWGGTVDTYYCTTSTVLGGSRGGGGKQKRFCVPYPSIHYDNLIVNPSIHAAEKCIDVFVFTCHSRDCLISYLVLVMLFI